MMKIKMSKSQWRKIGQKAGWAPTDPSDFSDKDIVPFYTPQEEEDAIFGPDEEADPYGDGVKCGKSLAGTTSENPYSPATPNGIKKFDEWARGFRDGRKSIGV